MLFQQIVYGPIHSRRLGNSLGVNLSPLNRKFCNFDCVYCECGLSIPSQGRPVLPTVSDVLTALEKTLCANEGSIDTITFSGNGEPTLHPQFKEIIEGTCVVRDKYCPTAKVSVLSNATTLYNDSVREALMKCDNRVLKLDSAIDTTMRLIDRPVNKALTVQQLVENLRRFDGDFTLQTCFLRGDGIDNTTSQEVEAWSRVVEQLHPKHIMVYAVDRDPAIASVRKLPYTEIAPLVQPLIDEGYDVQVYAQ